MKARNSLLLIIALFFSAAAVPEDIDLFRLAADQDSSKPNILFLLDNTANWDSVLYSVEGTNVKKSEVVHDALNRLTFQLLGLMGPGDANGDGVIDPGEEDYVWRNKIRFGIMTLADNNNPKGGRLLLAVDELSQCFAYKLHNRIYEFKIERSGTRMPVHRIDHPWILQGFVHGTITEIGNDGTGPVTIQLPAPEYYMPGAVLPFPSTLPATTAIVDGVETSFTESPLAANTPVPPHRYAKVTTVTLDYKPGAYVHTGTVWCDSAAAPVGWSNWVGNNGVQNQLQVGDKIIRTRIIDKANNKAFALSMNEAYRYYMGLGPRSGTADGVYAPNNLAGYDPAALDGSVYKTPISSDNLCADSYLVFVGNGRLDNGENNEAEVELRALGGVYRSDPISLDPSNYEANWSDEFARFLANNVDLSEEQGGTQNIKTFAVDVYNPELEGQLMDRAARALLKSIGSRGQGGYASASTAEEFTSAITDALDKIRAENSVFAATTLPVSVNVRGTNLNQVYMGVFRPDADWKPRWMGNLKLYKLGIDDNNTLVLVDSEGNPAEEGAFIQPDAVSYWTLDSDFWSYRYDDCTGHNGCSDRPDGKEVEKGGAAQRLRNLVTERIASVQTDQTRALYTCQTTAGCGDSSEPNSGMVRFTLTNVTGLLGVNFFLDGYAETPLMNWIYGRHKPAPEIGEGDAVVRASLHGDVLHSRPAVIAYDGNNEDSVVAYYGANDGIFHAVKGGRTNDPNNTDGQELWGFIFPEHLGSLKKLYNNVTIETDPSDPDYNPKPYFADGSIGAYTENDPNTGDVTLAHLFVTMRRGGRSIYAFDVTTQPTFNITSPQFDILWRIDNNTTGYGELGQTWSEPKVSKIYTGSDQDGNPTHQRVVVFGGGYDPNFDDYEDRSTRTAVQGRDVFITNAETGALIWKASNSGSFVQEYPIPSDITVLSNANGIYRLYFGDTGGNVWRANINQAADTSLWTVEKLASLGADQKFLYPPDVVRLDNGNYAVLIGSGNRENPKNVGVDVNTRTYRFYMLEDTGTTTNLTLSDLTDVTEEANATVDLGSSDGWYFNLRSGEQVVSGAVTLNGITYFNTSEVTSSLSTAACAPNLGIARLYHVAYQDGATPDGVPVGEKSRYDETEDGGLPPSPVPVIVEIDGEIKEAVVSGTKVATPPNSKLQSRLRKYWYRTID